MNLTTLLTNCRNFTGDALTPPQTWTDAQLTLWINAAISSYSVHFPRRMDQTIDAAATARQYNLANNIRAIISVEYQPVGVSDTPPTYYQRHDRMLEDFFTTDKVYDWIKIGDSDSASAPSTIIVNPATAADADTYYVEYLADHTLLSTGADILSVPDRHINLIYLYMRWCAIQELSTGVKRSTYIAPGGGGTLEQPYSEIDLKRTYDTYLSALTAAKKAESESVNIHWPMDKYGRIT